MCLFPICITKVRIVFASKKAEPRKKFLCIQIQMFSKKPQGAVSTRRVFAKKKNEERQHLKIWLCLKGSTSFNLSGFLSVLVDQQIEEENIRNFFLLRLQEICFPINTSWNRLRKPIFNSERSSVHSVRKFNDWEIRHSSY